MRGGGGGGTASLEVSTHRQAAAMSFWGADRSSDLFEYPMHILEVHATPPAQIRDSQYKIV